MHDWWMIISLIATEIHMLMIVARRKGQNSASGLLLSGDIRHSPQMLYESGK